MSMYCRDSGALRTFMKYIVSYSLQALRSKITITIGGFHE